MGVVLDCPGSTVSVLGVLLMKTVLLAGVAALLMATSAAHTAEPMVCGTDGPCIAMQSPDYRDSFSYPRGVWIYPNGSKAGSILGGAPYTPEPSGPTTEDMPNWLLNDQPRRQR
jgi:hypothetical protein